MAIAFGVAHPGARGEASEEDWLRVFKDRLPYRYQADPAFVIDSQGACSEQIDVVIGDRLCPRSCHCRSASPPRSDLPWRTSHPVNLCLQD